MNKIYITVPGKKNTRMAVPAVFSPESFGAELARTLDALYAIQCVYHRDNSAHEPHRGLFAHPEGSCFFAADMLTRHYYLHPREIEHALFEGRIEGLAEALHWDYARSCSRTLMRETRERLAGVYQAASHAGRRKRE